MLTLVKIVQTSIACPSQWDAWTADGTYVYLRYRHGYGTVETAHRIGLDDYDEELVAQFTAGDGGGGRITLDGFIAHVADKVRIAPNAAIKNLYDPLRDDEAVL